MPDVVVIGGGVVGTMAAWQLAEAGAEVTLLERGALASGATSKSQGLVLPPDHAELVPLWRESIAMYARLHDAGAEFCFDRDGFKAIRIIGRIMRIPKLRRFFVAGKFFR